MGPVIDRIHPQSNKIGKGAKIRARGDSKVNDSPAE